jgi:hypothetical protein
MTKAKRLDISMGLIKKDYHQRIIIVRNVAYFSHYDRSHN